MSTRYRTPSTYWLKTLQNCWRRCPTSPWCSWMVTISTHRPTRSWRRHPMSPPMSSVREYGSSGQRPRRRRWHSGRRGRVAGTTIDGTTSEGERLVMDLIGRGPEPARRFHDGVDIARRTADVDIAGGDVG